jgi:hypothetical protein
MPSLLDTEAIARAAAIHVDAYDIDLDLTRGDRIFRSTSTIRFTGTPDQPPRSVKLVAETLIHRTGEGRPHAGHAHVSDRRERRDGTIARRPFVVTRYGRRTVRTPGASGVVQIDSTSASGAVRAATAIVPASISSISDGSSAR